MSWNKDTLLEDLGLAQQNHRSYSKRAYHIDKGEVDPKSYGGVACVSTGQFDDEGFLQHMDLRYWVIYPDGRYEVQHLFQLEFNRTKRKTIELKSLSVLGRDVPLNDSQVIDNLFEAIRRIHVNLRDREAQVPPIASIFRDCFIEDIVGEKLPLPGFHEASRLYFPISSTFNIASNHQGRPEIILPLEAIRPLMGIRKNTIDVDHSYMGANKLRVRGGLPEMGRARKFEMTSSLQKFQRKKRDINERELLVTQVEADLPDSHRKPREIIKAHWVVEQSSKGEQPDIARLTQFSVMARNTLMSGFHDTMAAIGTTNRMHSDMLKLRDYPRLQDYLAEYNLLDHINSSSNPPPKGGRFVLTSMGGNNLREIYPGIGEDIGGNCKVVETQWVDHKTGSIQKLGAVFDLGAYIIKQASDWTGGGADIIEKLRMAKHIFISHHHLDHLDFIIPYIKRGIITPEHTLHFTPEVYEMAKDKLAKWGIKKHDTRMPHIHLLKGAGVIDLKDHNGIIRMSIAYGVDAVPHSAKDTPFIAYGRNGRRILGSYMYLGDMRFDEDWFADHDSPFWDPVALMLKHDPKLNPEHLVPTYAEQDGTSTEREGRNASERQVEDNLTYILDKWLFDKQAAISMIGTNDGRRETGLRVANRTGRKGTAFGAAVEKIFAIANKHGVNPYRFPRPDEGKYDGIESYLGAHAKQLGIEPTEFAGRTSDTVKEWFNRNIPGSLLVFLSGSQGNPVEMESVTYKLAEGTSYFDADPATSKTARPADLKDWAILVSQGAIPGNGKYQKKMIRKLAARGAIVFESFDENIRIHNPGAIRDRILDDIKDLGKEYVIEADTIVVKGFPIHASGHGRNGDFRLWLHKIKAKMFGLHHTDDMKNVIAAYDAIEEEGMKHPGHIFQNAEEVEIGLDFARTIGRTHTSVILTREIAVEGQHYNKRLEASRLVVVDDRSISNDLGFRGSSGGVYETTFGVEDLRDVYVAANKRSDDEARASDVRSEHCVVKEPRPFARTIYHTPEWDQVMNLVAK